MASDQNSSPEYEIALNDPGDEVTYRFRYQWSWAAILCCSLLDETMEADEIFCEHHEDVLIKNRDGSFTGDQVKTRGDDQPLWKAKDEAVVNSCVRFAKLENDYRGRFQRFRFVTNHPFHIKQNGQDLVWILKSIKDAPSINDLPNPVASWVKKISKEAEVSESVTFDAMSKTEASDSLPKLQDSLNRLIHTLADCWAPAKDCSLDTIRRVAQALIDECGRASSLDHKQQLPSYLLPAYNDACDVKARIGGKRMTLERVNNVLEQGRDSKATLDGDPNNLPTLGEGDTDLLHRKLEAGGFSIVSSNSAEDLRDKADYLVMKWIKQFGTPKGLEKYDHIRSLVLSDAGRSFDATQRDSDGFGPNMRDDLHRRLQERRGAGDKLFDTTNDHLEGVAFSLTAECKIRWSHACPWETDDESN